MSLFSGPCAKKHVVCTLVTPDGRRFVGTNWCANPQTRCPRAPGDDYTLCKTLCHQPAHAEIDALYKAGDAAKGAHAYIEGQTYACRHCQESLFAAGVVAISMGAPN